MTNDRYPTDSAVWRVLQLVVAGVAILLAALAFAGAASTPVSAGEGPDESGGWCESDDAGLWCLGDGGTFKYCDYDENGDTIDCIYTEDGRTVGPVDIAPPRGSDTPQAGEGPNPHGGYCEFDEAGMWCHFPGGWVAYCDFDENGETIDCVFDDRDSPDVKRPDTADVPSRR